MLLLKVNEGKFEDSLIKLLKERGSLSTIDIYNNFSDMNEKTVAWHLHECVKQGIVKRIGPGGGRGVYVLSNSILDAGRELKKLNAQKRAIYEFLVEAGYHFYVSGLDCFNDCLEGDSDFPLIICTDKNHVSDLRTDMMRNFDCYALAEEDLIEKKDIEDQMSKYGCYVLSSKDFTLQQNNFAFKEKAFVDLYYAVTRQHFPFPIEALPKVLSLFKPNEKRFHFATKDRQLAHELDFLLNYNIEFLRAFVNYLN